MQRIAPTRYTRRRKTRMLPLVAVPALLIVAVVAALALVAPGRAAGPASGEPATSTPRSEWRQGEVPCLYQTDPAWADEPYAGGTIRENGCGPTCLAMVYVALTGSTEMGPVEMAALSERGGYVSDGMTAWTLMTDGAAQLGLSSEELPASADAVREALLAGRPVICSMRPGDFTTVGHFIVLAGLADDGTVVIRDPNSEARTRQTWDVDRILAQCANLWSFSA